MTDQEIQKLVDNFFRELEKANDDETKRQIAARIKDSLLKKGYKLKDGNITILSDK